MDIVDAAFSHGRYHSTDAGLDYGSMIRIMDRYRWGALQWTVMVRIVCLAGTTYIGAHRSDWTLEVKD
jgi:hypothetical protein